MELDPLGEEDWDDENEEEKQIIEKPEIEEPLHRLAKKIISD